MPDKTEQAAIAVTKELIMQGLSHKSEYFTLIVDGPNGKPTFLGPILGEAAGDDIFDSEGNKIGKVKHANTGPGTGLVIAYLRRRGYKVRALVHNHPTNNHLSDWDVESAGALGIRIYAVTPNRDVLVTGDPARPGRESKIGKMDTLINGLPSGPVDPFPWHVPGKPGGSGVARTPAGTTRGPSEDHVPSAKSQPSERAAGQTIDSFDHSSGSSGSGRATPERPASDGGNGGRDWTGGAPDAIAGDGTQGTLQLNGETLQWFEDGTQYYTDANGQTTRIDPKTPTEESTESDSPPEDEGDESAEDDDEDQGGNTTFVDPDADPGGGGEPPPEHVVFSPTRHGDASSFLSKLERERERGKRPGPRNPGDPGPPGGPAWTPFTGSALRKVGLALESRGYLTPEMWTEKEAQKQGGVRPPGGPIFYTTDEQASSNVFGDGQSMSDLLFETKGAPVVNYARLRELMRRANRS